MSLSTLLFGVTGHLFSLSPDSLSIGLSRTNFTYVAIETIIFSFKMFHFEMFFFYEMLSILFRPTHLI